MDQGQHLASRRIRVSGHGKGPVAPTEAQVGAIVGDTHPMAPGLLRHVVAPLDQERPGRCARTAASVARVSVQPYRSHSAASPTPLPIEGLWGCRYSHTRAAADVQLLPQPMLCCYPGAASILQHTVAPVPPRADGVAAIATLSRSTRTAACPCPATAAAVAPWGCARYNLDPTSSHMTIWRAQRRAAWFPAGGWGALRRRTGRGPTPGCETGGGGGGGWSRCWGGGGQGPPASRG